MISVGQLIILTPFYRIQPNSEILQIPLFFQLSMLNKPEIYLYSAIIHVEENVKIILEHNIANFLESDCKREQDGITVGLR